ncbi:Protein of unknown function [Pyronema omphalodes CBS 100304]|uniref:Uncharacterized protein n=1 Tax=Pyronema omphalodes (strain CBS 100304) TaxID=1076935 RepID=U4LCA0_PYROM|nr:Protein of unknown function [Pyronema omphalodes CBS 100304]
MPENRLRHNSIASPGIVKHGINFAESVWSGSFFNQIVGVKGSNNVEAANNPRHAKAQEQQLPNMLMHPQRADAVMQTTINAYKNTSESVHQHENHQTALQELALTQRIPQSQCISTAMVLPPSERISPSPREYHPREDHDWIRFSFRGRASSRTS